MFTQTVADITNMNKLHVNMKLNRQLQNFMYTMLRSLVIPLSPRKEFTCLPKKSEARGGYW
jgi:hypothetical protein